ncbi:uncharacterized protein UTRI_10385 [Ustilago trichophora]|uniref:Uncharacterized protein n=1 Tax=Ustilago trichophora TaxID=86804 RepID=A0A5C3EA13_9BASI|nr:uncharacterized protein UTRI_10385 [Ustilago trichophora]
MMASYNVVSAPAVCPPPKVGFGSFTRRYKELDKRYFLVYSVQAPDIAMVSTFHRALALFFGAILTLTFATVAIDPNDKVANEMLEKARAHQREWLVQNNLERNFGLAGLWQDFDPNRLAEFHNDAWELAVTHGAMPVGTHREIVGTTSGILNRGKKPIYGPLSRYFYTHIPHNSKLGLRMGLDGFGPASRRRGSVLWKYKDGHALIQHVDVMNDWPVHWHFGELQDVLRHH